MVCTLLAGFNVVAFAADDNETVSVAKFYNDAKKGGDGEHLFTKDADEMSWLSSLKTWNNEGEAWKAPVSSSTSVYRCYNPNSGEHLYVDEDYADYLAATGWNKEKVAFYSDDEMGTPVYRLWNGQDGVGSHHFTTDAGEVDWLVGQGWTAEDIAFYGVKEESNVVALADVQGLQADGTALKGDTLALVFGSTFGVPKNVAWYKNGAVVATDSTEFNQTHGSLIIITDRTGYGAGSYYAQVENTKGQVFKTNTISVVDEGLAVMSNVTFNDNYEALTLFDKDDATTYWSAGYFPQIAKETTNAVLDVTLNKDYDGNFYLEKSDVKKGSDIKSTAFTVGSTATSGSIIEVEKAKDFTNDNLAKAVEAGYGAMKYVADDGTTQYKILVGAFLNANVTSFERGKEFRVIFDQTGKIKDSKSDDEWNATAATCPYVLAPTSIAVTDVQNDTTTNGWTVTAYMGSMEAVWMNDVAVLGQTPVTTVNLYENDKQSTTGASGFGSIPKGLTAGKSEKSTTAGADKPYVYATLSAPKGIFGATALDLTSDIIATPDEIAASVKIEQSELDASDFNVSVSKLRGGATAFLIGGSSTEATQGVGGWYDDFVDNGKYIAVTHLDAGTAVNYTFEDAVNEFDDPDNGDIYAVVLVPDDTSSYTKANANTGVITQKVSMIIPDTAMSNLVVDGGEIEILDAFVGLDQYGNEMDWDDDNDGLATLLSTAKDWKLATLTSDADQDLTGGSFTLEAAAATSGEGGADFTITFPALAGMVSKGDTYTYKLTPFQTLKLTCTQGAIAPDDDIDATMWALTIE